MSRAEERGGERPGMASPFPRLGPALAVLEAEARWALSQPWMGLVLVLVLGGGWVQDRVLELALPQGSGPSSAQLDWSWLCLVALQALWIFRLGGRRSLTQELGQFGELVAQCGPLLAVGAISLLPALWQTNMFHVEHSTAGLTLLWVLLPQTTLGLLCLRLLRRPNQAALLFLFLAWWLPAAWRIPTAGFWPAAMDSRSLVHLWAGTGSTWNTVLAVLLATAAWTALTLTLPRRSGPRSDTD